MLSNALDNKELFNLFLCFFVLFSYLCAKYYCFCSIKSKLLYYKKLIPEKTRLVLNQGEPLCQLIVFFCHLFKRVIYFSSYPYTHRLCAKTPNGCLLISFRLDARAHLLKKPENKAQKVVNT